jgi:hypothetical protein
MEFIGIKFTKEALDKMEENEKIFLIQFGEFLNEINILYRCFFATSNSEGESEVEKKSKAGQLFLFIRLLASKLYEGWNILRTSYFGSQLSKTIEIKLEKEASESLAIIKKYFSNKNNLEIIRNKIGFHYDNKIVKDGLNNLESVEAEDLKISMTHSRGNCFYSLSDVIMFSGMRKNLEVPNLDEFLDHLMGEIIQLCSAFQNFGDESLWIIILKYQGSITEQKKYNVTNIALHSEIKLPFLIDTNKKKEN